MLWFTSCRPEIFNQPAIDNHMTVIAAFYRPILNDTNIVK